MFRKEALRQGVLKTINANTGIMVGQSYGGPTAYNPRRLPVVIPGQGTYDTPKPSWGSRMKGFGRKAIGDVKNFPSGAIQDPKGTLKGTRPFGMGGGISRLLGFEGIYSAVDPYVGQYIQNPYGRMAVSSGLSLLGSLNPYIRGAGVAKSVYDIGKLGLGKLSKHTAEYRAKPIGEKTSFTRMGDDEAGVSIPSIEQQGESDKKIIQGRPGSGRPGFQKRVEELKAEGDELLQNANEEDVANLNDIQSQSLGNIGPVPPGEEGATPTVTEKETVTTDTEKGKGKGKDNLSDAITGVDNKEFKTPDGKDITNNLIGRAREISKELRAGQSSQAKLVFLANLASGLLSGTTTRRGIGGAMEVFGRALGPAVNNYATLKLKENELENNFMQSALEIASDEMDRKNQVYENPEGTPGVVQILQNGRAVNLTAIRLKDGTVRAAIPGASENGRNVYTTLTPGSYVRFASSDKLAKPQVDLLRELDAKYRAYALGQNTIRIIENFKKEGKTGAGPIGKFNLFKQRFGSAFKDVLGRDVYDDMESAQRRLEKEKNKAISDLMVSENLDRKGAEELLQSKLGGAADQSKIMKLIKDATGEEDKQKLSQLAINETVMVYALANSLKSKDRLTEKDIKMAKQLVNIFPLLRGQDDVIRDLRSVNNTILGDIDSLQSNWTNSLLGETATINLYRRQYGFAEATDDNLPPELADIYQGKTDKDIAGSITLN